MDSALQKVTSFANAQFWRFEFLSPYPTTTEGTVKGRTSIDKQIKFPVVKETGKLKAYIHLY